MRPYAIYFPQFYATPTNDTAWGKGFTDWCLVAGANMLNTWPRRAPARGFYDGESTALHHEHFAEAARAGLGGFAVYHYWFYTHQELNAVEKTLLKTVPDEKSLPWFLIWANESWTRRWLGDPRTLVALSVRPSQEVIDHHCAHLARCFAQEQYLRIAGRPLFAWYNLGHFEVPEQVVGRYREALRRMGYEPWFVHFVKNPFDTMYSGFMDGSYLFEPRLFFASRRRGRGARAKRTLDAATRLLGKSASEKLLLLFDRAQPKGITYSAADFARYIQSPERQQLRASLPGLVQEVISPGWNNAPRYAKRFTRLEDVPPQFFRAMLQDAIGRGGLPPLINAWNEWSEGAAIEPCAYLGSRYLDAVRLDGGQAP
jgi:hypothetical protein